MWVKMKSIAARPSVSYDVDDIVEVDDSTGRAWIAADHAEKVDPPAGLHGPTLTTIPSVIMANSVPQKVAPVSMADIVVGSKLAIDTGNPELEEIVEVKEITRDTFTAVFKVSHARSSNVALLIPPEGYVARAEPGVVPVTEDPFPRKR